MRISNSNIETSMIWNRSHQALEQAKNQVESLFHNQPSQASAQQASVYPARRPAEMSLSASLLSNRLHADTHISLANIVNNISSWFHPTPVSNHIQIQTHTDDEPEEHLSASDIAGEVWNWLIHMPKKAPTDSEANANGISNFAQIDPGIFRGHVPDGANSFNWMRDARGIGTEIDLREDSESPSTADWAQAAGIQHVSIPISDVGRPTGDQINQFFSVIDAARRQQAQDPNGAHGVFIHCEAGMNRTGTMSALLRIREGMSSDNAVREAESRGLYPITPQPLNGNLAADEIGFIYRYGDAYHALGIRPGTSQEQEFNQFFTEFMSQNMHLHRSEFADAIVNEWNNNHQN